MTAIKEHNCFVVSQPIKQDSVNLLVSRHLQDSDTKDTYAINPPIIVMEVDDLAYHHNSSVTLPLLPAAPDLDESTDIFFADDDYRESLASSHPEVYAQMTGATYDTPEEEDAYRRRRTLVLVATTYRFLEENENFKLLVAGHTDSSGDDRANFVLSNLRALNVLYLIQGKRDEWVSNSDRTGKVEDYQLICKHFAQVFAWNCDPGEVDDDHGPHTGAAVQAFQAHYNQDYECNIATDGIVGPVTWGAIFDAYMTELAGLLELTRDELTGPREHLRYADEDNPTIGCGERILIDEPSKENYRSEKNRRVELLFFHAEFPPDLESHLDGGAIRSRQSGTEASDVYGRASHCYRYIEPNWWEFDPPSKEYSPKLEITESDNDWGEFEDDMNSDEYDTEFETRPVEAEHENDEWAFVEVMDALDMGDIGWSGTTERDDNV